MTNGADEEARQGPGLAHEPIESPGGGQSGPHQQDVQGRRSPSFGLWLAFALAHTLTCFGGFWGIPAALLVLRAQGQWGAGHEQAARRTLRRSQALSLLGVAIMALAVAVAVTVAIVQVVVGRGRVVPVSY